MLTAETHAVLVRVHGDSAAAGRRVGRVFVVVPVASLALHLCLANYVYDVPFAPANLTPLLLGLAVRCGRSLTSATAPRAARAQLVLPMIALLLTLPEMREMSGDAFGVTVTPLRLALMAMTIVYLDGWLIHGWPLFMWLAGACLGTAGVGATVMVMGERIEHAIRLLLATGQRFVPRTPPQWGVASVAAAFVLLALGAVLSLRRRPETDG